MPTIRRYHEIQLRRRSHPLSATSSVDLFIVGGGINGVGIARDAAGRGLSVCLVEQDDLANHTSSASSKLIHGGLRYLLTYEFRLVREALIERERLLGIAPHIIWPMSFVLPHAPAFAYPRWMVRMGLFLYDHMGVRRRLKSARSVGFKRSSALGNPLRADLQHGFVFSDCWVQDSRLVVLNAMDAAERGATILTRTRFISAEPRGKQWLITYEDMSSGKRSSLNARAIVNAAGSWVGEVIKDRLHARSEKQVRLIKGSHIIVPRLYEGEHAYFLINPDGRIEFVIPYEHNYSLIGTTDIPFAGDPDKVSISDEEIAYLCDCVNRYFNKTVAPKDIVWSYAGVRPLYDDGAANASTVTREYELEVQGGTHTPILLSVFGGKITTFRKLAERALEKLQPLLGTDAESWTASRPLPGGDIPKGDLLQFIAHGQKRWPYLAPKLIDRLARAYGTRMSKILDNVKSPVDLGRDFGGGLSQVEVDYLRDQEWAVTADDILWRRSKLGLHVPKDTVAQLDDYLSSTLAPRSRAL